MHNETERYRYTTHGLAVVNKYQIKISAIKQKYVYYVILIKLIKGPKII